MSQTTVPRERLVALIEAGLQAPSGDNCQPWQAELRPDGFDLRWDAERAEALFDVKSLASRIGLGAFLENVALAAQEAGYTARFAHDPDPAQPELWARAAFEPSQPIADPLFAAINHRHTQRGPFDQAELSDADRKALTDELSERARFVLLTDPERRGSIEACVAEAEAVRAGCKQAHLELQRWLRWTPEEVESSRDGLDVRTLGASSIDLFMLRTLRNWTTMRAFVALGGGTFLGRYAGKLLRNSAAVGALVVQQITVSDVVAAGRLLQRVWLRATTRGLALSPFAALPLFALHLELEGGHGFNRRQAARIAGASQALSTTLELGGSERALMLFRIGHAKPQTIVALRRPVEEIIKRSPDGPR